MKSKDAFDEFAVRLFDATQEVFPPFASLWAKWERQDLIPHLSDFDSRLVCSGPVRPRDWVDLDRLTGEIHLSLLESRPDWARIMEHTPGVAVTYEEMLDESLFHPETQQWSLYLARDSRGAEIEQYHCKSAWGRRHEFYFLKRFLYFYGPYQRGIDPPINLGAWSPQYALHSRVWHYFVPALQAALSLYERRTYRGKHEALEGWMSHLPHEAVLRRVREIVDKRYETAELHDDALMARLEEDLFACLQTVLEVIKDRITILDASGPPDPDRYRRELNATPPDPLMVLYDGVRFSRIRRGRYYFYLNCPEFFDADRLIASELRWLRGYFTVPALESYAQLVLGGGEFPLEHLLAELQRSALIDGLGRDLVRRVFRLSHDGLTPRDVLRELMPLYPDYHLLLEEMLVRARRAAAARFPAPPRDVAPLSEGARETAMTDDTLLVAFTMDVECPGEGSRDAGFTDWDLGERAIRGYAERLAAEGCPVTFFIVPPAAPRYASVLASLRKAGCELGLHVHPQDIGYPEFLGGYTEEEQVALLEDAVARWSDVFGFRPYSFRPGNCSANDATFAALVRAGFRQGSVSIPERRMPALRSVWTGAPKDVHFAHRANRLLAGDSGFVEVPITVDWESMIWGGQTPLDLRIEAVDARSHSYTIAKNVVRMCDGGTPVKCVCAFTHNYFDYSDIREFRRITLDGVVGHVRSIAEKHGLKVRGVTLEQIRHEVVSSIAVGGTT